MKQERRLKAAVFLCSGGVAAFSEANVFGFPIPTPPGSPNGVDQQFPSGVRQPGQAAGQVDLGHAFGFFPKLTGNIYDANPRYELFADMEPAPVPGPRR